jgi:hypothetical protein
VRNEVKNKMYPGEDTKLTTGIYELQLNDQEEEVFLTRRDYMENKHYTDYDPSYESDIENPSKKMKKS